MTCTKIIKIISTILGVFVLIYMVHMHYVSAKGTAPIDLKKQLASARVLLLIALCINIILR